MSFLGMWCLIPMHADVIAQYSPELAPAVEAKAARPGSRALIRRWQQTGSTEEVMHEFLDEAGPSALDERICLVYEAWERGCDRDLPYLTVSVRKGYPAAALAYALGPQRSAELPGWFGDLVLSPEQVLRTLPAVERVFTWTAETRARAALLLAEALDPEGDRQDIDELLDGVLPVWRAAATAGRGLLGANFVP
ncbi:hypothetical protein [Streptomyces sp. NRRL WC-3742]|uniref:hypothetical protein n=1 Tax=Streptomyces sp. NRRL WC-3742 TaxID=1463934 RepID=UPI000AE0436E|nr:hypothetical protein [Streptomyces sp. NRRL WC-3742]